VRWQHANGRHAGRRQLPTGHGERAPQSFSRADDLLAFDRAEVAAHIGERPDLLEEPLREHAARRRRDHLAEGLVVLLARGPDLDLHRPKPYAMGSSRPDEIRPRAGHARPPTPEHERPGHPWGRTRSGPYDPIRDARQHRAGWIGTGLPGPYAGPPSVDFSPARASLPIRLNVPRRKGSRMR
jgi:hypothetical protein